MDAGDLYGLVVRRGNRSGGVGTALGQAALESAAADGAARVVSHVAPWNRGGVALHRALGATIRARLVLLVVAGRRGFVVRRVPG